MQRYPHIFKCFHHMNFFYHNSLWNNKTAVIYANVLWQCCSAHICLFVIETGVIKIKWINKQCEYYQRFWLSQSRIKKFSLGRQHFFFPFRHLRNKDMTRLYSVAICYTIFELNLLAIQFSWGQMDKQMNLAFIFQNIHRWACYNEL